MDDLVFLHARYHQGNVGPVGAYLYAVLAVAVAGQASGAVNNVVILLCQSALAAIDGAGVRELEQVICQYLAHNCLCGHLAVPDSLNNRGWPVQAVAGHVHALHAGFQGVLVYLGTSSAVQGNAAFLIECARNLLAHGCDNSVGRNGHDLVRLHYASASALVYVAQDHLPAVQGFVFQLNRRQKLGKFHAVLHCHYQFFLVGRHEASGPSVYQRNLLNARVPLGCPCRIHGSVSAADDNHVFT